MDLTAVILYSSILDCAQRGGATALPGLHRRYHCCLWPTQIEFDINNEGIKTGHGGYLFPKRRVHKTASLLLVGRSQPTAFVRRPAAVNTASKRTYTSANPPFPPSYPKGTRRSLIRNYQPPDTVPPCTGKDCCSSKNL